MEHIARTHPSLLLEFESEWTSLIPELKDFYLNPESSDECNEEIWKGWARSICHNNPWRDRGCQEGLTSLLAKKMEHSGVLFGVQDEKLDRRTESSLRNKVAENAVVMFQYHVMERAKEFLREILEKDGIEPFRRFLARVPSIKIDMKIRFPKQEGPIESPDNRLVKEMS